MRHLSHWWLPAAAPRLPPGRLPAAAARAAGSHALTGGKQDTRQAEKSKGVSVGPGGVWCELGDLGKAQERASTSSKGVTASPNVPGRKGRASPVDPKRSTLSLRSMEHCRQPRRKNQSGTCWPQARAQRLVHCCGAQCMQQAYGSWPWHDSVGTPMRCWPTTMRQTKPH
jgi:hypothetical protein